MEENDDEEHDDNGGFNVHESSSFGGNSDVEGVLETIFEESGQKENNLGHFKTSMVPRTGGLILSLMDELVKLGQVMGYKMDGCNSRGILCVWDPNSFRKSNATVSDYFIMIWGVWRQTGNDLLIIAVYAPHDLKDKQMPWDYLTYEIGKWKGEVVIIGDFNEVRYKSDRFGSVFNVQGTNVFNSFITNVRLEEVPLGGRSFTWCHKSVTKMSKLDRFLIYENLLNTCSNITAITLKQYLSDHRPILLHESYFAYGLTPFRVFHHWIEMEGFFKVVEDAWREGSYELEALEEIINKGDEMAQKAKVKWFIEGDENASFFHGMLNKKWSLPNIRGIMVDGMWIESPNRVKFFHHFSSIFDKPDARRAHIEMRVIPKGCNSSFIALIPKILDANKVVDAGIFKGIKLSSSLSISHMFYVDDAVFVGQWCD
nr:RNA-directed DNA polymerase, eukaryota [Tanacetum cinerariifolium]